jgi:hypothetical protein
MTVVALPFYAMHVAIPRIMLGFGTDVEHIPWMILAFAIAEAVMMVRGWAARQRHWLLLAVYVPEDGLYVLYPPSPQVLVHRCSIAFRVLHELAEGPLSSIFSC